MLVTDNATSSITAVQLLTSGLAFLVSIITAVLGWIVKGAGDRMKRLEEQQEYLAEKTERGIEELSERRAQSERRLEATHLSAIGELQRRTTSLEIQVGRSVEANINLTKSIDKLGDKVERIGEEMTASRKTHRGY